MNKPMDSGIATSALATDVTDRKSPKHTTTVKVILNCDLMSEMPISYCVPDYLQFTRYRSSANLTLRSHDFRETGTFRPCSTAYEIL